MKGLAALRVHLSALHVLGKIVAAEQSPASWQLAYANEVARRLKGPLVRGVVRST